LREAMREILPEPVRTRRHPSSLRPLFLRGVAEREIAALRRFLRRRERVWPQYVREEWVAHAAPGSRSSEVEELVVWQCVCLELWLMRLQERNKLPNVPGHRKREGADKSHGATNA
jgi:hypothetical protein